MRSPGRAGTRSASQWSIRHSRPVARPSVSCSTPACPHPRRPAAAVAVEPERRQPGRVHHPQRPGPMLHPHRPHGLGPRGPRRSPDQPPAGRGPTGRAARPPTRGSRRSVARRRAALRRRPPAAAPTARPRTAPIPVRPGRSPARRPAPAGEHDGRAARAAARTRPRRSRPRPPLAAGPARRRRIRPPTIRTSTTSSADGRTRAFLISIRMTSGPASRARPRCPRPSQRRPRRRRGDPANPDGRGGSTACSRPSRAQVTMASPPPPPSRADRVRPVADSGGGGEAGRHRAHGQVDQLPAPAGDRARDRERAAEPGQRIGDGVGAEHRPGPPLVTGPADEPARHRRVVAERDQLGPSAVGPPVPGDAQPDLPVAVRVSSGASPSCLSARGRDASITTFAAASSAASAPPPGLGPKIKRHAVMPRMQPVEEPSLARPGSVRPVRRLDLDDVRPGQPEQPRAERPGPH